MTAETRDSIGILSLDTVSQQAQVTAAGLLSNQKKTLTPDPNPIVLSHGSSIIKWNEFKSLRPGGWIYNTIIDAYCKHVVVPQVDKVQLFSTHFMSQLMAPTETEEMMLRWGQA